MSKGQSSSEEVAEKYLSEFFNFNKDERYNIVMENLSNLGEELNLTNSDETPDVIGMRYEELQDMMVPYNEAFKELCTNDCMRLSFLNRIPYKYEQVIVEAGEEARVKDIELRSSDSRENSFYYTVIIELKIEDELKDLRAIGRVDLNEMEDKKFLVNTNVITGIYLGDDIWPDI